MPVRLRNTKTCNHCKAEDILNGTCTLGYTVVRKFKYGINWELLPLEPCPKPKTLAELVECEKIDSII